MNAANRSTLCVALIALSLAAADSAAQSFPEKAVQFVIGIGAGSSSDISLRIITQELTKSWGKAVIVDNRVGAGGNIAASYVAKSLPDGYTLLFSNSSITIGHSYYRKLNFNALTDLIPVSLVIAMPQIVSVNPSLPVSSIKDLIALAKTHPGDVLFSSGGSGSPLHMAGELFAYMANVKMMHVPYKGAPPSLTALISGEVGLSFPGLPVALPQVRRGKIRAIAVTTSKRAASAPDIPTIAESGVPGYEQSIWSGMLAPAETPRAILDKVSGDIARILKDAEIQKRFNKLGVEVLGSSPMEFDSFFKAEIAKWAAVVKATGIRSN